MTTITRNLPVSIVAKVIIGRDELITRHGIIKDGVIAELALHFNGRERAAVGTMKVQGTDITLVSPDGTETLIFSNSYNNLTIHTFKWLRVKI